MMQLMVQLTYWEREKTISDIVVWMLGKDSFHPSLFTNINDITLRVYYYASISMRVAISVERSKNCLFKSHKILRKQNQRFHVSLSHQMFHWSYINTFHYTPRVLQHLDLVSYTLQKKANNRESAFISTQTIYKLLMI